MQKKDFSTLRKVLFSFITAKGYHTEKQLFTLETFNQASQTDRYTKANHSSDTC